MEPYMDLENNYNVWSNKSTETLFLRVSYFLLLDEYSFENFVSSL
jgi:hypothetical protein